MKSSLRLAVALIILASSRSLSAEDTGMPPTVADGAKLKVVYSDDRFFEGPTWNPKTGKLYFTAFGRDSAQILRLDGDNNVTVWMDKTQGINGTFLSLDGRLLGAQGNGCQVVSLKIGKNGPEDIKSLSDGFEGKPYVRPNDIVQSPAGGIYYTDPDFRGKAKSAVYYLDTKGNAKRIITHLKIPNGVLVSNDGKALYVSDSLDKRIYSYPIKEDGTVDQGKVRIFFDPDTENVADPDGMTSDENDNLYFAMRGGVWAASPKGDTLGFIRIKEFCSNCTFGGKEGKTLFMTCSKKVYSLKIKVRGAQLNRKE